MGFSFVEKINEKIYIGTMSNSRGYVSYQTVENAFSGVPYIIIYRHGKKRKRNSMKHLYASD